MKTKIFLGCFWASLLLWTASGTAQEAAKTDPFGEVETKRQKEQENNGTNQMLKCDPATQQCVCEGGAQSTACGVMEVFFCQAEDKRVEMTCKGNECSCKAPKAAFKKGLP